jgi:hypothetical protein
MIESKVIEILNLDSKTGIIDAYKHKKSIIFFNILKILVEQHKFSMLFSLVLKFIFFIQIILEILSFPQETQDLMSNLANFFGNLFLFDKNITDSSTFSKFVIAVYVFTFVYILLIVYLIIFGKNKKFLVPIQILAFLNFLLADFLMIPIFNILMKVLKCDENGIHLYLSVACYSADIHIIHFMLSILTLLIFLSINFIFSYYMNEIGNLNNSTSPARVNCNYELFSKSAKLLFFFSINIVKNLITKENETNYIVLKILIIILSVIMLIYTKKKLYYFEPLYNIVTINLWSSLIWSGCISLIKSLFKLNETIVFHFIGWIIIFLIVKLLENDKDNEILADINIFNLNSLKDLVSFNEKILTYCTVNRNYKEINKGTAITLATSFEEILEKEEELNVNHKRFVYDSHVLENFYILATF